MIREQIVRVETAAKSDPKPGPQVEFPETVQSLFSNADLWLKVDRYRFTPDAVVKHLITPNSGPKDPKRFSVFIADRKRELDLRLGLCPVAALSKSRLQFWDSRFVCGLLTNIILISENYRIRTDVTPEELLAVKNQAISAIIAGFARREERNVLKS